MSSTKLIYDRTRLSSEGSKPYYKVIYDEVKSVERNLEKVIRAKDQNEADAKVHEMQLDESINIRKKIPLMNKLVYRSNTKKFSKTADLFIAIGEALESNNPKSELDKLAKTYKFKKEDLKKAVKAYIAFDDELSKDADKVMKQAGFSETKEFDASNEYDQVSPSFHTKSGELVGINKDSVFIKLDNGKISKRKRLADKYKPHYETPNEWRRWYNLFPEKSKR